MLSPGACLDAAFGACSDAIVAVSRDARLLYANAAAAGMLGIHGAPEALQPIGGYFTDASAPAVSNWVAASIDAANAPALDARLGRNAPSSAVRLECWRAVLPDGASRALVIRLRRRDDVGAASVKPAAADAAQRSPLASGVAHDFNNVLTTILGHVDLLRPQFDPLLAADAERIRHVDEIERAALRAAELTRSMLGLRRGEGGGRGVDVAAFVRDFEPLMRRALPASVSVHVQIPPTPCMAACDLASAEQVLTELLRCAARVVTEGDELKLGVELAPGEGAEPARVRISAWSSSENEPCDRTPLQSVVESLRGAVEFEHLASGGCVCTITLPAATGLRPAPPPAAAPRLTGGETILLCEDDETVRDVVWRFLQGAGYTVLLARNADEAIEICGRADAAPHLLLTDVIMPGLSGPKLAALLRTRLPGLRTMFISGYPSAESHEATDAAPPLVLEKPFSRRTLLKRVRAALDG